MTKSGPDRKKTLNTYISRSRGAWRYIVLRKSQLGARWDELVLKGKAEDLVTAIVDREEIRQCAYVGDIVIAVKPSEDIVSYRKVSAEHCEDTKTGRLHLRAKLIPAETDEALLSTVMCSKVCLDYLYNDVWEINEKFLVHGKTTSEVREHRKEHKRKLRSQDAEKSPTSPDPKARKAPINRSATKDQNRDFVNRANRLLEVCSDAQSLKEGYKDTVAKPKAKKFKKVVAKKFIAPPASSDSLNALLNKFNKQ